MSGNESIYYKTIIMLLKKKDNYYMILENFLVCIFEYTNIQTKHNTISNLEHIFILYRVQYINALNQSRIPLLIIFYFKYQILFFGIYLFILNFKF